MRFSTDKLRTLNGLLYIALPTTLLVVSFRSTDYLYRYVIRMYASLEYPFDRDPSVSVEDIIYMYVYIYIVYDTVGLDPSTLFIM